MRRRIKKWRGRSLPGRGGRFPESEDSRILTKSGCCLLSDGAGSFTWLRFEGRRSLRTETLPTKWRGEWECGLRFEGHLGRVDGKQKTLVLTRTYPEGGERRNRICTEEVIDSQVSERYGRHFGRWRDHKILLRSKRTNKSPLENFMKSSDRLAVICCLENGFVLESRVCILLDSIRTIISYYYVVVGIWGLHVS